MQLFLSPDFHIKTLRRKPKSSPQKLAEWQQKIADHQLSKLPLMLAQYIPQAIFCQYTKATNARRRLFSFENTFWGMFLQRLQADSSCQHLVHQFRLAAQGQRNQTVSPSTSAYCQARQRLPIALIKEAFHKTTQHANRVHPEVGRRVVAADGTGLLASDTKENQLVWPQQSSQKEGCAFPQLRLTAMINLHSGHTLSYGLGNKHSHELNHLRDQEESFRKGDIFVGDKGFISYYDQARLLEKGVDSIIALAKRKPVKKEQAVRAISPEDLIVSIPKPATTTAKKNYPAAVWEGLPDSMLMRQIEVSITIPGYRSERMYLLTTLLNEREYPAELIMRLYQQRWRIELHYRDLKTTLGMEMIKGKTPNMVEKEVLMYLIVGNVMRQLMLDSGTDNPLDELAFKSCVQTMTAFHSLQHTAPKTSGRRCLIALLAEIKQCRLFQRQGRVEPRVLKRRPKPFKLMMKPREVLRGEMMA